MAYVERYEHKAFEDRTQLRAAEVVAFELLDPALRSRGGVTREAEALALTDPFRRKIERLIAGGPAGRYVPTTLSDLLEPVAGLERRIEQLERGP